ncbi:MAG: AzlC family ABC transporter permease [bacterium]|nr:AzlC family ABC transporter permease [bacterium]
MNAIYTKREQFQYGFKRGLPITMGYLPVSFAFGLTAVKAGMNPFLAILMSLTNLTSAGQFAGASLINAGAAYLEITLTTFVINIRYMLMSLSLSQKLDRSVTFPERLIFSFGITDETFAVAASEEHDLTYHYMIGLIVGPIAGWTFGTMLGAFICSALPEALSNALGIALYGMFIAIIIPPCKHSVHILYVILSSCLLSCIFKYTPGLSCISAGFRVIIVTLVICSIAAYLFPIPEQSEKQQERSE